MLGWRDHLGRPKQMSCRVAMLRMHRDGLIALPPARNGNANTRIRVRFDPVCDPRPPITLPAGKLAPLRLESITSRHDSHIWNQFIHRYHYLGYKPQPGAQMRYFVWAGDDLVALLGFAAAAWKAAARDRFIGWNAQQRERNLHLIANNTRFLILPWVQSKNLASRILAIGAKQLPDDFASRYGYRPVLLETFVEIPRFRGTCYRAANWILLGQTTGRGKRDRYNEHPLPIKDILVLPLTPRFQSALCAL